MPALVRTLCGHYAESVQNPQHYLPSARSPGGGVVSLHAAQPFSGPIAFKHPKDSIVFYVEDDGLHVRAVTCDGETLWRTHPFRDAELEPYRFEQPQITRIGGLIKKPFTSEIAERVFVRFNSFQFGALYAIDGSFDYYGRD